MKIGDKLVFFAVVLIVVGILVNTLINEKELAENKKFTTGKIIEASYTGGKYYIKYSFKVKNKKYYGEVRTNFFKCDNGIDGCLGENFEVIYSGINPNNNDINLGKYNHFKMRNRIIK
ncbi:hypothetical protein ACOSP6_03640 [Tenacibaculum sp. MEBiC06402]|uniref:hypothetical protein n=1 Tax=unclassified Tenacibaculum TaxID=2635139 RepID=UPI003B997E5C